MVLVIIFILYKGVLKFSPNDRVFNVYKGDFVNDNFEGCGTMYFKNGDIYIGEFMSSMIQGKGSVNYGNDQKLLKYEGDFYRNKKVGKEFTINFIGVGKLWYKNTDIYVGEFKENVMSGYGCVNYRIEHPDLVKFEGEFDNDMANGKGILVFKNGSIYHATFNNNVLVEGQLITDENLTTRNLLE